MTDSVNLTSEIGKYPAAAGFLLDSHVAGMAGGTGQKFDWSMIPASLSKPIILAGGLTTANVKLAINRVKPYAVDVSSGVESSRGIKDPDKIAAFIREVLCS